MLERVESTPYLSPSELSSQIPDIYDGISLLTFNWEVVFESVVSTPYLSPSDLCSQIHRHL